MGTPLLRGRMISDDDTATSPFVLVINKALAEKYFAGQDPLGKELDLGGENTGMIKPYTVVGILANQVDSGVAQAPKPLLMLPYQQIPASSLFYPLLLKTVVFFAVKTHGNIAVAPA
ncbi:MAG: ABC transporter permease, partial [Candidatus Angelobacter sp.]